MTEVFDLDARRPAFTSDPYATYAELRASRPVCQVDVLGIRAWLVTRYDDVREALTHPLISSDPQYAHERARAWPQVAAGLHGPMYRSVLVVDPPDHTRLRRLLNKEFSPRRVEALVPRIRQLCHELVDQFLPDGKAELMAQYAAPVPLTTIMELYGVPVEDRASFRRWGLIIGGLDEDSLRRQPEAFAELHAYLNELIARKARQRSPAGAATDLLDALIALRDEGDRLSHDELVGTATVLLLAGHATTANLIGNGVLALLRHPDQLALLRAQPALLDGAIEEFLRYDPPSSQTALRYTRDAVELGGARIPAGEVLILCLAAANRDPARFVAPDQLDIRRIDQAHLAFGHGVHHCIGAALARVMARVALPILLDACPDLALDPEAALRWRLGPPSRGLMRFPVVFTPGERGR